MNTGLKFHSNINTEFLFFRCDDVVDVFTEMVCVVQCYIRKWYNAWSWLLKKSRWAEQRYWCKKIAHKVMIIKAGGWVEEGVHPMSFSMCLKFSLTKHFFFIFFYHWTFYLYQLIFKSNDSYKFRHTLYIA